MQVGGLVFPRLTLTTEWFFAFFSKRLPPHPEPVAVPVIGQLFHLLGAGKVCQGRYGGYDFRFDADVGYLVELLAGLFLPVNEIHKYYISYI